MGNYNLHNLKTNLSDSDKYLLVGIYRITSPTGKVYIGQSRNIRGRWYVYTTKHFQNQEKLYRSIKKYGVSDHTFDLIHDLPIDVSKSVLDKYEIFYIKCYKDAGINLLNIQNGGVNEGVHSEETRKKISAALTGKKLSPEHIQKLIDSHKGKRPSKETIEKKRQSQQNRSEDTLQKMRDARLGKKHTTESIRLMSEIRLEYYRKKKLLDVCI